MLARRSMRSVRIVSASNSASSVPAGRFVRRLAAVQPGAAAGATGARLLRLLRHAGNRVIGCIHSAGTADFGVSCRASIR